VFSTPSPQFGTTSAVGSRETGSARGATSARIYNPGLTHCRRRNGGQPSVAFGSYPEVAAAAAAAVAAEAAVRAASAGLPVSFPPLHHPRSPWAATPPPAAATPASGAPAAAVAAGDD